MTTSTTPPPVPVICPCCHQTLPEPFRCIACGSTFTPSRAAQKYCGRACSTAWSRKIAMGRDTSKPYLRRPRSEESKAATAAKKEQALEDLFQETAPPVLPPADDTEIEAMFAAMRAELAEETEAEGEIERPSEATDRPYAAATTLPVKGPAWSPPRRLGQRNAKQARLHAAGIFTA